MKFRLKYPKLLLLLVAWIFAYILFSGRNFLPFHDFLLSMKYLGIFFSGLLFTYGLTSPPATALLLILSQEYNILLSGLIAGFGALIGDLIIFTFIRSAFNHEIKKISKNKFYRYINDKAHPLFRKYIIWVLAGLIIASPLPDEIGIALFAISTNLSRKQFSIISYLMNTAGILIILIIGRMI